MRLLTTFTSEVARSNEGQDLLEYALLASLIAVFAVGAVTLLGNTINTALWEVIAASSV